MAHRLGKYLFVFGLACAGLCVPVKADDPSRSDENDRREEPSATPDAATRTAAESRENAPRTSPGVSQRAKSWGPVREPLDRFGIDESRLRVFLDRQPLQSDEHESLHRILFRVPRIALDEIERRLLRDVPWQRLRADPDSFRGEFFHLLGRATQIDRESLIPELVERFGFEHYYRVSIELDDSDIQAEVYARVVPHAWTGRGQTRSEINERCSLMGMFLKVGDVSTAHPQLVFAARRIAWHPDHVNERLGVDDDHVLLGSLGMDVGLFSDVHDRKRIVSDDRECFYQLLAAMEVSSPTVLHEQNIPAIDVPMLLRDPAPSRGNLFEVFGTARRAFRIRVDDPDIRSRFGIDHYFELDVFVPLEASIRIVEDRQDTEGKLFSSYPVTVCVRHLPQGMPEGEDIRQDVRIDAFFVKLWAYHTQFMSEVISPTAAELAASKTQQGRQRLQFSPLMIGRQPELIRRETASNPLLGLTFGSIFLVFLAAVGYAVWKARRGDRDFQRAMLARKSRLAENGDLDGLKAGFHDRSDVQGPESN